MKIKIYADDDDGEKIGYMIVSGKKLATMATSVVAAIIWLCQRN